MKYYTGGADELIGFDFYCDIANNIIKARETEKMTQEDLACKAELSVGRLSAIERVKTRILIIELEKIANALNVTVDFLIDAEFGCHGKECLYLVWDKDHPTLKLYRKATSSRMATLIHYEDIRKHVRLNPRTRFCARLVGLPFAKEELLRMYPKRDQKQPYDDLEPDENLENEQNLSKKQ